MISQIEDERIRRQLVVWWMLWGSMVAGLSLLYFIFNHGHPIPDVPVPNPLYRLVGFVPLFVSIIIRWLVLPRDLSPGRALVMYVIGLWLADGCGLMGLLLGGPYRNILFLLGLLGIFQFAPFYARTYYARKPTGFIPNN